MNPGDLDIFYGELTVNRAFVYARLPRPVDDEALSLVGQVRGPRCSRAQTLPLTSPLVDLGPGPTLLARALVPDPCFWSPDLPAIYDVTVNLLRGTELLATVRRELGFRSLGVRGRNFALESKRWVLRGVSTQSTTERLPRDWHEAAAAYVADDSDLIALEEASLWGTLAVVHVADSGERAVARLRELAHYPAVAMAVVLGELPANFKRSDACPNLLLANWMGGAIAFHVASWADVQFVAAEPELLTAAGRIDKPIVVARYLEKPLDLAAARAACDALQRDLAPLGQFAGYVV